MSSIIIIIIIILLLEIDIERQKFGLSEPKSTKAAYDKLVIINNSSANYKLHILSTDSTRFVVSVSGTMCTVFCLYLR